MKTGKADVHKHTQHSKPSDVERGMKKCRFTSTKSMDPSLDILEDVLPLSIEDPKDYPGKLASGDDDRRPNCKKIG